MKLLKKLLIKNYENTSDQEVRFHYGITAGIIGIVINVVLCSFKIAVGLISGSVAIVADAVNNVSDAASSVVTVFGFKLSNRPADEKHPFGHARYEYIAALIIAIIVVILGVFLLKSGIEKIITPQAVTVNAFTYAVLGASVLLKAVQGLIYRDFGKSINSDALRAVAADSRNDAVMTTAVIISSIVIQTTGVNIDGYVGTAVSLIIILFSLKLLKDTVNPLLGTVPDKDFVGKIYTKLRSYDVVIGFHDMMIHSYGPAITYASVHIEVDASGDLMGLHDAIDNIERDFMNDMNVHLVIHMDPVAVGDEETNRLRALVADIIAASTDGASIHDFRLVQGPTHTNVLFDVVLPYKSKLSKKDILTLLREKLQGDTKYYFVIEIDRQYC